MKKYIALVMVALLACVSLAGQGAQDPVTPFKSTLGMSGLILEAAGFGLVVGAGAATSIDLSVGLAMFSIAPVASIAGAWLTQSFMQKTDAFWIEQGLVFDSSSYIRKSRTFAIVTTSFGVASMFLPVFIDGTAGAIISIICAGVSVGSDIIGLYGPRLAWTKTINETIYDSGIDWKAALQDG